MKHREQHIQFAVADYLRLQYPDLLWFHPANERATSPMQGAKFKRMGVLAGVADIIIFRKTSKALGLCIELKSPDRTQSGPQQEFQRRVQAEGWAYYVCHSFDEARIRIDAYLRESYVVNKS